MHIAAVHHDHLGDLYLQCEREQLVSNVSSQKSTMLNNSQRKGQVSQKESKRIGDWDSYLFLNPCICLPDCTTTTFATASASLLFVSNQCLGGDADITRWQEGSKIDNTLKKTERQYSGQAKKALQAVRFSRNKILNPIFASAICPLEIMSSHWRTETSEDSGLESNWMVYHDSFSTNSTSVVGKGNGVSAKGTAVVINFGMLVPLHGLDLSFHRSIEGEDTILTPLDDLQLWIEYSDDIASPYTPSTWKTYPTLPKKDIPRCYVLADDGLRLRISFSYIYTAKMPVCCSNLRLCLRQPNRNAQLSFAKWLSNRVVRIQCLQDVRFSNIVNIIKSPIDFTSLVSFNLQLGPSVDTLDSGESFLNRLEDLQLRSLKSSKPSIARGNNFIRSLEDMFFHKSLPNDDVIMQVTQNLLFLQKPQTEKKVVSLEDWTSWIQTATPENRIVFPSQARAEQFVEQWINRRKYIFEVPRKTEEVSAQTLWMEMLLQSAKENPLPPPNLPPSATALTTITSTTNEKEANRMRSPTMSLASSSAGNANQTRCPHFFAIPITNKSTTKELSIDACSLKTPRQSGISIVISIMNRTANIEKYMSTWLIHKAVREIVIVDWSTTIKTEVAEAVIDIVRGGASVPADSITEIVVVRVNGEEAFFRTAAQNLGVLVSTSEQIIKLDSDISLSPGFFDVHHLRPGTFLVGNWRLARDDNERYTHGNMMFYAIDFFNAHGYNEFIHTYGWDDSDIAQRFQLLGLEKRCFDLNYMYHNPHSEEQRSCNLFSAQEQQHSKRVTSQALTDRHHYLLNRIPKWTAVFPMQTYLIEKVVEKEGVKIVDVHLNMAKVGKLAFPKVLEERAQILAK